MVIYASLICLSADPDLWSLVSICDRHLLFQLSDFQAPDSSLTFRRLLAHQDTNIRAIVSSFYNVCLYPMDKVPDFDPLKPVPNPGWMRDTRGIPVAGSAQDQRDSSSALPAQSSPSTDDPAAGQSAMAAGAGAAGMASADCGQFVRDRGQPISDRGQPMSDRGQPISDRGATI